MITLGTLAATGAIEQRRMMPRTAMKSLVGFSGNLMNYSVPYLVNNTIWKNLYYKKPKKRG